MTLGAPRPRAPSASLGAFAWFSRQAKTKSAYSSIEERGQVLFHLLHLDTVQLLALVGREEVKSCQIMP